MHGKLPTLRDLMRVFHQRDTSDIRQRMWRLEQLGYVRRVGVFVPGSTQHLYSLTKERFDCTLLADRRRFEEFDAPMRRFGKDKEEETNVQSYSLGDW